MYFSCSERFKKLNELQFEALKRSAILTDEGNKGEQMRIDI